MNKDCSWDAYRYVLDDPTLDRAEFEARMLSDVQLALSVAQAVADIETLHTASRLESDTLVGPALVASSASGWMSKHRASISLLGSLAAILLVMFGWFQLQRSPHKPIDEHQSIVDSWLAMNEADEVATPSEVQVDESVASASTLASENWLEVSASESAAEDQAEDWLLDAAREFFAQGQGAAG